MKLVPVSVMRPRSVYAPANTTCPGYAPSAESRFAVVRDRPGEGPWLLVHRRTGMLVASLLPVGKFTRTELLATIQAWDAATHLDMSYLDSLPQTVAGSHERDIPRLPETSRGMVAELRTIAADLRAGQ